LNDDVVRSGLLKGWTYHEDARWVKGWLLRHGDVSFQGGTTPKHHGGSGGKRQRLLIMVIGQGRTTIVVPFRANGDGGTTN
jgi:hypothetical protein